MIRGATNVIFYPVNHAKIFVVIVKPTTYYESATIGTVRRSKMANNTRDEVRVHGFTYDTGREWMVYEESDPKPFG